LKREDAIFRDGDAAAYPRLRRLQTHYYRSSARSYLLVLLAFFFFFFSPVGGVGLATMRHLGFLSSIFSFWRMRRLIGGRVRFDVFTFLCVCGQFNFARGGRVYTNNERGGWLVMAQFALLLISRTEVEKRRGDDGFNELDLYQSWLHVLVLRMYDTISIFFLQLPCGRGELGPQGVA